MSTPGELRFAPLVSQAETSFWQRLKQEKLDRYRLDESAIPLRAYLPALCTAPGVDPAVALDSSSFDVAPASLSSDSTAHTGPTRSLCLPLGGRLVNYNTFERFRDVHKQTLIIHEADEARFLFQLQVLRSLCKYSNNSSICVLKLWKKMVSGEALQDPTALISFLLISFAVRIVVV